MEIEVPSKELVAKVRISTGEATEELSLDSRHLRVCFGRRQVPIKKIKDHKERPVRDYIYRQSNFVSNEHCLLSVEPVDVGLRLRQLLAVDFFRRLPLELVRMVVGFETGSLRVSLQDLGSMGNTYVQLPHRQVVGREEVFLLEKADRLLGSFELHYVHTPEPPRQFGSAQQELQYYASKTQRLSNILRNTHEAHLVCSEAGLKPLLESAPQPSSVVALNRLLYHRYFVVVAYNYRSYVWVLSQPAFRFDHDGFQFEGQVLADARVAVASPQKRYSALGLEKEGQTFKPSSEYYIRTRERIVLADARIFDLEVLDQ